MNITIEFSIFESVQAPRFISIRSFCLFVPNLRKKDISGLKEKILTSPSNQHIQIKLNTKFHLKQAILSFQTRLLQKLYFWSKAGQRNISIEFSIFRSAQAPSFMLSTIFRNKFIPKKYFQSRTEEVKITIEFRIFQLVQM